MFINKILNNFFTLIRSKHANSTSFNVKIKNGESTTFIKQLTVGYKKTLALEGLP